MATARIIPSPQTHTHLAAESNQALGLGHYAIEFMRSGEPGKKVLERTELFNTDASLCGLSAIAMGTNAPNVLRDEALAYPAASAGFGSMALPRGMRRAGATVFGSARLVHPEKAVAANAAAVREWDSNGTNFGYNPALGHTAGEFGHNDFYAVPIAAAQMMGRDGAYALRGMVLLDEIRGRLAEVFSLKSYKIDHVLHGAIASAVTFGAMCGASAEEIESAVGMVVAHAVPFRAIRAGKQLSDSKGASAAVSAEFAVLAMRRSMAGFVGPRDIFRNPEAVFRLFEGPGQMFQRVGRGSSLPNTTPKDASPFDLVLAHRGDDFAVMGMHFKMGLYEHQSAGALQGVIDLLEKHPHLLDDPRGAQVRSIVVTAYEPAFGIIGDPAKRDPRTRQSADHSMLYLVCTMLRKAIETRLIRSSRNGSGMDATLGWKDLMLGPHDFAQTAIFHPLTRSLMEKMTFRHGGAEYDAKYPDGIPTSVQITDASGRTFDSGLVMYPAGHARNTAHDLHDILAHKFRMLANLAADKPADLIARYEKIGSKNARQLALLHDHELVVSGTFE